MERSRQLRLVRLGAVGNGSRAALQLRWHHDRCTSDNCRLAAPSSRQSRANSGHCIAWRPTNGPWVEISFAAVPLASVSRPLTIAFLCRRLYEGAANERVFLVTRLKFGSIKNTVPGHG